MAQVVEVSGVDVEDAVARALSQLGLTRDQVDVDVVREGKKGFLRFGAEESIVRVTAKPGALPASQRPRGDFRGGRGRGGGRPGGGGRGPSRGDRMSEGVITSAYGSEEERQRLEGAARAAREDGEEAPSPAPARPAAAGGASGSPYQGSAAPGAQRDRGERGDRGERREGGEAGRGRSRGGRGGRGRGGGGGGAAGGGAAAGGERAPREREREPRQYAAASGPAVVPGAPEVPPVAPIADAEDELDLGGRTLRHILSLLGLNDTEITAREPETAGDGVGLMTQVFDITGLDDEASDELGLLIGRRGETLQSLQYLVNVIVSSRYDGEQIFALDVEQYKRRREQSLVEMAHRIANEVRATGDVITLEPMPPAERRIIHLALQEEEGVVTESVGEGSSRQVEILPASE